MRGDVETPGTHFRPRHKQLSEEDIEASSSDRGFFEDLERLARTPELRRAWDRVRTAAIRGAAAGILIKGGLHTLTFVVYLLSRIRGKARQRVATFADVLRDTVLHTCFLAALGSSYTALDEGIALIFGKSSTQRWRALLAGLIAGQSLRITGSTGRHYSLATYILLRGLTLLVRTGNKPSAPPALRALLRPTRLQHGDTLLMCAAASQILYSFIMAPSTLPPTYVRFITRIGGKDPAVWAAVREHAMRNSLGLPPGPLRALQGTPLAFLNTHPGRLRRTPCEFFHPGQSCAGHAVSVMPPAYGTALAVYVPFYLVSSVLVHRTALLARPHELLPKIAMAVLRSSAFLAVYMGSAFAGACAGFCATGTSTGAVIAGSVWSGGLATLMEKKSRRMELAMYCAARALEAFIRCCWLWSGDGGARDGRCPHPLHLKHPPRPYLPPGALAARKGLALPPHATSRPRLGARSPGGGRSSAVSDLRLDLMLFSLGCGAIMHCYSDSCGEHRDVFKSKYLNVLDFIFGNEGVQQGSITHVPTNLELVSSVRRRLRTMSRGVLSSSDYSTLASSATYSPLPRSAAHSQGEGLCLNESAIDTGAGSDVTAPMTSLSSCSPPAGHGHHGSDAYSRYLQHSHQRHHLSNQSNSQNVSQHLQGGRRSTGNALVESRDLSSGGDGGGAVEARGLYASASTGLTMQTGKPPVAPSLQPKSPTWISDSSARLNRGCKDGAGGSSGGGAPGSEVALSAPEAEEMPSAEGLERQQQPWQAEALEASHSVGGEGGGSSQSSGDWEDVWDAATGNLTPNTGIATNPPAATTTAAAGAVPAASMSHTSLRPLVGEGGERGGRGNRSPFVDAALPISISSEGGVATDAEDAASVACGPSTGTLVWAAKLVKGVIQRAVSGAVPSAPAVTTTGGLDTAQVEPKQSQVAAFAGISNVATAETVCSGDCGGSWVYGRLSSMRRSNTAPLGLQPSLLALQLLSDPAAEHCGRGRSSYQDLQRLSAGNAAATTACGFADGGADAADVRSPASMSSSTAEAAAALFPTQSSPARMTSGRTSTSNSEGSRSVTAEASALSSPARWREVPPSRARLVPVPNANSRTPAFRPHSPLYVVRSATLSLSSTTTTSTTANSSTELQLPPLFPSSRFSGFSPNRMLKGSSIRAPHATSTTAAITTTTTRGSSGGRGGCSSVVTFEPIGALSHPSPVSRAPMWPRMSLDFQTVESEAVCRSAPEARQGGLRAALVADNAEEEEAGGGREREWGRRTSATSAVQRVWEMDTVRSAEVEARREKVRLE